MAEKLSQEELLDELIMAFNQALRIAQQKTPGRYDKVAQERYDKIAQAKREIKELVQRKVGKVSKKKIVSLLKQYRNGWLDAQDFFNYLEEKGIEMVD